MAFASPQELTSVKTATTVSSLVITADPLSTHSYTEVTACYGRIYKQNMLLFNTFPILSQGARGLFSILRPFAILSASLSRYRNFFVSDISMSSIRLPQITPLIRLAFGFRFALSKNPSNVSSPLIRSRKTAPSNQSIVMLLVILFHCALSL